MKTCLAGVAGEHVGRVKPFIAYLVFFSVPGGQTEDGRNVVLAGIVEVDGHEALELARRAALFALLPLGLPQLLCDHGHAHHKQVTAGPPRRTICVCAAAADAAASDRSLSSAALPLHKVAAGTEAKQMI